MANKILILFLLLLFTACSNQYCYTSEINGFFIETNSSDSLRLENLQFPMKDASNQFPDIEWEKSGVYIYHYMAHVAQKWVYFDPKDTLFRRVNIYVWPETTKKENADLFVVLMDSASFQLLRDIHYAELYKVILYRKGEIMSNYTDVSGFVRDSSGNISTFSYASSFFKQNVEILMPSIFKDYITLNRVISILPAFNLHWSPKSSIEVSYIPKEWFLWRIYIPDHLINFYESKSLFPNKTPNFFPISELEL